MFIVNQLNYPDLKLGRTKFTWARWGCLSSVIVMGYNWLFGKTLQPEMASKILNYNSNGELIWSSLSNLDLRIATSVRKSNITNTRKVIDKYWSDNNTFCAIEINNGTHFVWQIGRWIPLLGYRIVNPFGGKKEYCKNFTGCRIISKI